MRAPIVNVMLVTVGMYSGFDYPYKSCLCTFWPAIPTSSFNFSYFVNLLILMSQVMLSPSGEVSVCPGNQLSFRCSTNFSILEWDITVFQSRVHRRQQFVTPISPLHSTLTILSRHLFNIARTSDLNANPLISTLTIVNAMVDINATIINCTEIGSSRAESSTSKATINIINPALSRFSVQ